MRGFLQNHIGHIFIPLFEFHVAFTKQGVEGSSQEERRRRAKAYIEPTASLGPFTG